MKIQEDSGIEAMLSMHYWMYSQILLSSGKLEEAFEFTEKTLKLAMVIKVLIHGIKQMAIGSLELSSLMKASYITWMNYLIQ